MRFLLSSPLPLLLILSSSVWFDSLAAPHVDHPQQEPGSSFEQRHNRSSNDIRHVGTPSHDYSTLVESYKSESIDRDAKPLPLASEPASNSTVDIDKLSADEVKSRLESTREDVERDKELFDEAEEAVREKTGELERATADYKEKKRVWDQWAEVEKAAAAAAAAQQLVTEKEAEVTRLNGSIAKLETALAPFELDVQKAKQDVEDIKNIDTVLPAAEAEAKRLETEIGKEDKNVGKLKDAAKTALDVLNACNNDVKTYALEFNNKECMKSENKDVEPCKDTISILDGHRQNLPKFNKTSELATKSHEKAVGIYEQLKVNKTLIDNKVSLLQAKNTDVGKFLAIAEGVVELAEINVKNKKKPLNDKRDLMQKAEDALKNAKIAKTEADQQVEKFPDSDLSKKASDKIAYDKAKIKKDRLEGELPPLQSALEEKKKVWKEATAQVEALQKRYEKLTTVTGRTDGLLIGLLVGGFLIVVVIAGIAAFFVVRRKRRGKRQKEGAKPSESNESRISILKKSKLKLGKKSKSNSKSASSSQATVTSKDCNEVPVKPEPPKKAIRTVEHEEFKKDALYGKMAESAKTHLETHINKDKKAITIFQDDSFKYAMGFGSWLSYPNGITRRLLLNFCEFAKKIVGDSKVDLIPTKAPTKSVPFPPDLVEIKLNIAGCSRNYIQGEMTEEEDEKRKPAGGEAEPGAPRKLMTLDRTEHILPWSYFIWASLYRFFPKNDDADDTRPDTLYPDLFRHQATAQRELQFAEKSSTERAPVQEEARMPGGIDEAVFGGRMTLRSWNVDNLDEFLARFAGGVLDDDAMYLCYDDISELLDCMKNTFEEEPVMLEMGLNTTVVTDIHGQYKTMMQILSSYADEGKAPWQSSRAYVFTGDYVDRGKNSLQTFTFLLLLKLRDPKMLGLLRGNHEDFGVNKTYGFHREVMRIYGKKDGPKLIAKITAVFARMPLCALLGPPGKHVLCAHGGVPSIPLKNLRDINKLVPKVLMDPKTCQLAMELLWNDPANGSTGFPLNMYRYNSGNLWGEIDAQNFGRAHGIKMIVRGHSMLTLGYHFFAGMMVVSIFSAANYGGKKWFMERNHGATIAFEADGSFSIHVFIDVGGIKKKYWAKLDEEFCLKYANHSDIKGQLTEAIIAEIRQKEKKKSKKVSLAPTSHSQAPTDREEPTVTLRDD